MLIFQDYMDDVHGKEIPLMHTTVKIPGQKPRGSRAAGSTPQVNDLASDVGTLSLAGGQLQLFLITKGYIDEVKPLLP
ncbi:hypothetical protein HPB50_012546 [Hyalomma asiaticum]|uniref:Uncharacterized protein n=1 Tax=Hyalomma asiaticum TaxID=266040 RepID=A0ACB7S5Z6_HYAAI|nr:hypothetical protein HPB50_012546 [Hyalomma asiaticum]